MRPREERGIALTDYFQMLWERRWVIVAVLGITTVLAFLTRPAQPQAIYRSQVTLRVQILSVTGSGTSTNPTGVPPQEIEQARNAEVAATTARALGQDDDGVGLLERIEVSSIENTDLLQLAITGRGAATVQELQEYAKNYVTYRNKLDEEKLARALQQVDARIAAVQSRLKVLTSQVARATSGGRSTPLDLQTQVNATTAIYERFLQLREQILLDSVLAGNTVQLIGSPITQRLGALPTRTLRLVAGPVVGFLLGAALAIALGVLRPRISSRDRVEERLGYPVLATIPFIKAPGIARDPLMVQRSSPWGVEGVRMLQAELQLVEKRGGRVNVIVIASPEPGDGRTTIAVNLAGSFAAAGRSVALLRADRVAEIEEDPRKRGFDSGPLETILVRMHRDGFAEVVPKVMRAKNQAGLLGDALTGVVEDLAGDFEVVVVDTRPLSVSADSLLLAGQADAVVVVLRQHKTSEVRAIESIDILDRHGVSIVGTTLNAVRAPFIERYRARSAAASRRQMEELRESVTRQAKTRASGRSAPAPRSVPLPADAARGPQNGESRERETVERPRQTGTFPPDAGV